MSDEMMNRYEQMIQEAQLGARQGQLQSMQNDLIKEDREKGMLQEQLDVTEILDNIHHLLKGYTLQKVDGMSSMVWVEPTNGDMKILTDYGINYIMSAVQWYLNKNTLLSNYDEDTILRKMKDFSITIIDDVFMEYDKMFCYPTLEDCKNELELRMQNKIDTRAFALELMGDTADKEEIKKELLKEMEPRIAKELEVIKAQKIKNKLKRFESIIRFVQDTVHSAYLRAWRGQERTTLRQHIHISETKGGLGQFQQQQPSYNPLQMFRR